MPLSKFVKKLVQSRKIDMEKGRIDVFGIPAVMFPVDTWVNLGHNLESRMGEEAYQVMFEIGKDQGRQSVQDIGAENKMGQREFLQKMIGLANIMGTGEMKVENSTPNESLELSVKDSPLLRPESKDEDHIGLAEFLRGTAAGVGEGMFDEEVRTDIMELNYNNPNRVVFKVSSK